MPTFDQLTSTQIPMMAEDKKEESAEMQGLAVKMLQARTLIISQGVTSELTQRILTQLVLLEQDDPEAPITIFINSPGGEVFQVLQFLICFVFSCPVTTIVGGFAASMGSILSLAANPGRRFAFPNAKIMIHQPLLMGYQGRATECQIQAREILKTRDRIIDIYCEQTGKDYETIKQAIDRDNWMVAEEALEFGLLDKIVQSRMELNELLKSLS